VNRTFVFGQLLWKGAMRYTAATRVIVPDSTWSGPWAPLYDDGPWTSGGHEPAFAVAGDHRWGITVFVTPDANVAQVFEYGLHNAATNTWAWVGPNGRFTVPARAAAPVIAIGRSFP
jgi:hypothetical protein